MLRASSFLARVLVVILQLQLLLLRDVGAWHHLAPGAGPDDFGLVLGV